MCTDTERQLVERMLNGDVAAFEIMVGRHRATLVALADSRLHSLADAEDVAQEAFVQAFFRLHELRDPGALRPWLRRITERLALMRLRGRREEPIAPECLDRVNGNHSDEDDAVNGAEVHTALAQLSKPTQETVALTWVAGYTCAEAARILGVKEGTVKSRLNRARAKLRDALGVREEKVMTSRPTDDFTRRAIERLREEARRLLAEGNVSAAADRAHALLAEEVRSVYGDPEQKGVAATYLTAYDSGTFKPDEEATAMIGLPRKEQRRKECEANAALYGVRFEDLDWQLADVDMMAGTIGKPTGHGRDIWGVPVSRQQLTIIDTRGLCQRLCCSPLLLHEWVSKGCPILRCWPFARFDVERVMQWLSSNGISDWSQESVYDLERPIRVVLRAVYDGELPAEQAQQIMADLGYGVWEAPLPGLSGGWN